MAETGRRIEVRGIVQGVGFRPWVFRLARERGLSGRVRNAAHGVTIEAFGPEGDLEAFCRSLSEEPPPSARVREVRSEVIPAEPGLGFRIVESGAAGTRVVSIPADLATCRECASEVGDPSDRRHRYPFTNCTACGPRFTIALDVPYDRPLTTMARFPMCPDCRREYSDPGDRRFHAQPNACPACGPRLGLLGPDGSPRPGEALEEAAAALARGEVVAVKGLGGYHLACDAASEDAVRRLRRRKARDHRPFAVMVASLAAAEEVALIGEVERALLLSIERPIVLLRRRPGSVLADAVAPGSSLVGLMLPYTPLHGLLLAAMGRPLVMTSGNRADEPMATGDEEARRRLGGIADLFLAHDRAIANRCDDSVARVVAGGPLLLRRSRGYVPRPVVLPRPLSQPVLACGAHLKNTFCLAAGSEAWLGPHVGDLDTAEAHDAFAEAVGRLERFLGIRPRVVAHDLHPDYASTRYALGRPEPVKVGVQHHHAHVASALAEHGLAGPVLGVAFDGTGYGADGTAWGGELLRAEASGFERLATLRPLPLAGGEAAIREVWRLALALLDDAFEGRPPLDRLPLFRRLDPRRVDQVRLLARTGLNSPLAHGAGRYFDAVGALALALPLSRFEGEVALACNLAVDRGETGRYHFELQRSRRPWQIDLRPAVRALTEDLVSGVPAATVTARFHATLAEATAEAVRGLADAGGALPVVLTGGCFQNDVLAEALLAALAPRFAVHLHREVPAGDGGIALGQVVVADALARETGGQEEPCA